MSILWKLGISTVHCLCILQIDKYSWPFVFFYTQFMKLYISKHGQWFGLLHEIVNWTDLLMGNLIGHLLNFHMPITWIRQMASCLFHKIGNPILPLSTCYIHFCLWHILAWLLNGIANLTKKNLLQTLTNTLCDSLYVMCGNIFNTSYNIYLTSFANNHFNH